LRILQQKTYAPKTAYLTDFTQKERERERKREREEEKERGSLADRSANITQVKINVPINASFD